MCKFDSIIGLLVTDYIMKSKLSSVNLKLFIMLTLVKYIYRYTSAELPLSTLTKYIQYVINVPDYPNNNVVTQAFRSFGFTQYFLLRSSLDLSGYTMN